MSKFDPKDKYFQRAKDEGYRARSVFKLQAIQERFKIIKKGDCVLDLGCAPGSFLQYILEVIGAEGRGFGIDLQEMDLFDELNITTYKGDAFDDELYKKIVQENDIYDFDVITSDMAPKTSGIKNVDAGRSFELNYQVVEVAKGYLKKGGNLLFKAFPGPDHQQLLRELKTQYSKMTIFKPDAVRKSSIEEYVICVGKK